MLEGKIDQAVLLNAIRFVGRVVPTKSTLPVLSNVLIISEDDGLVVRATNLQTMLSMHLQAHIDQPGAITVPAALLEDVISTMKPGMVSFRVITETQTLVITDASSRANVKGIEADEYPTIQPDNEFRPVAVVPSDVLGRIITATAYAAATDDIRPVLAGINLRVSSDRQLKAVTSDGFRGVRSVVSIPGDEPVDPINVVAPAKGLNELAKFVSGMKEAGPVAIGVSRNEGMIRFTLELGLGEGVLGAQVETRLIDGNYPEIDRIIPSQYSGRSIVDLAELRRAARAAGLFATAGQNWTKISITPGSADEPAMMTVAGTAAEVGDNQTQISVLHEGDAVLIKVNTRFLDEMLKVMTGNSVVLEMQSQNHPLIMRPVGYEHEDHLVMPMTTRD